MDIIAKTCLRFSSSDISTSITMVSHEDRCLPTQTYISLFKALLNLFPVWLPGRLEEQQPVTRVTNQWSRGKWEGGVQRKGWGGLLNRWGNREWKTARGVRAVIYGRVKQASAKGRQREIWMRSGVRTSRGGGGAESKGTINKLTIEAAGGRRAPRSVRSQSGGEECCLGATMVYIPVQR